MRSFLRLGLRFAGVAAFLAFAAGCSVWVMGVVQSFGSQNGPKISTVVGNGTGGYSGDGGAATGAEVNQPYAVAVDSSGNLYIADCNNSLIREVDTSGVINKVAPATGLFNPQGVAIDGSNIYISDSGHQVIKEVTGGAINPVVGPGGTAPPVVPLNYPAGIAVDSSHNLYIADMGNSRILKFDGIANVTTVAGIADFPGYSGDGSPATAAHLNFPTAVAVDASGNVYIADGLNFVIRKINTIGNISTVAGNGVNGDSGDGGPALAAELSQPYGVAVDSSGNLYISELNSVVRKVDTSGNISTIAGNAHLGAGYGGDGNVATAAMLDEPWGLAIDSRGNLLIADRINNRIRKVGIGQ